MRRRALRLNLFAALLLVAFLGVQATGAGHFHAAGELDAQCLLCKNDAPETATAGSTATVSLVFMHGTATGLAPCALPRLFLSQQPRGPPAILS